MCEAINTLHTAGMSESDERLFSRRKRDIYNIYPAFLIACYFLSLLHRRLMDNKTSRLRSLDASDKKLALFIVGKANLESLALANHQGKLRDSASD